jgi:hypothetical protein
MQTRNASFPEAIEQLSGGEFKRAVRYAKLEGFTSKPRSRWYSINPDSALGSVLKRLPGYYVQSYWTYRDGSGNEVMRVYRLNHPELPKEYRPVGRDDKGWFIGKPTSKLPIYNLPSIANSFDGTVFVTEGEKACDAASSIGLLSTCCAGGARAANATDWSPLKDRKVIILPDNDEAGELFAVDIQKILPQATIWRLPGLPPAGDIYDWIEARRDKTREQQLAELRRLWRERA